MIKKISYIIYKILKFFDFFLFKIANRSFLIWFKDFIEIDSVKNIKILNKKISFFTPNYILNLLIDNFFVKEPETIEWINNFKNKKKIIFWDIGAGIGIYSIYAALRHKKIEVISFEPSASNLRILSRNISLNNLQKKIAITQFPLSNKINKYLMFKEQKFMEGVGNNTWNEDYNSEGKFKKSENISNFYGTTINYLLDNKILKIPNYIKIDVDGIEHLILMGASKYLKNSKIREISIELNEGLEKQLKKVFFIMKKNNFKLKQKKRNELYPDYKFKKYSKLYNYVFTK